MIMVAVGYDNFRHLRSDAVPDVTLSRAKFEYWSLARARCAAAVSTADILRNPA